MMKNKICQIWDELASANVVGMVKKSYSPNFSNCIYCIFDNQTNHKGVAISYDSDIKVNISQLTRLKDVQVYITEDSSLNPNKMLVILLRSEEHTSELQSRIRI